MSIFAAQSLLEGGMPFQPSTQRPRRKPIGELAGMLHSYVTPELRAREDEVLKNAFERATLEKYGAVSNDTD